MCYSAKRKLNNKQRKRRRENENRDNDVDNKWSLILSRENHCDISFEN